MNELDLWTCEVDANDQPINCVKDSNSACWSDFSTFVGKSYQETCANMAIDPGCKALSADAKIRCCTKPCS